MTKARLLACPGCARHVRISEPACVFCGRVLPESFGNAPALPPPPRMTRGGLYRYRARALAASTAALLTASCGSALTASPSEGGSDDGKDAMSAEDAPVADGTSLVDASDGASPSPEASSDDAAPGVDASSDDASGDGPAGNDASANDSGPSPGDAGPRDASEHDSGHDEDAAHPVDGGINVLYGLPSFDAADHDVGAVPAYGVSPAYGAPGGNK